MRNYVSALEIAIFSIVSLVFINSVYHLFTGGSVSATQARQKMAISVNSVPRTIPNTSSIALGGGLTSLSKQVNAASQVQRNPAESPVEFVNENISLEDTYETVCSTKGEKVQTTEEKLRITGKFCGSPKRTVASINGENPLPTLKTSTIENLTNQYSATVFNVPGTIKFSTDFIPLNQGLNKILMKFKYQNQDPVEITLDITRN